MNPKDTPELIPELSHKLMSLELDEFINQTTLGEQCLIYKFGGEVLGAEEYLFTWNVHPAFLYAALFYKTVRLSSEYDTLRKKITMINKLTEPTYTYRIIRSEMIEAEFLPRVIDDLDVYDDNVVGVIEWIACTDYLYHIAGSLEDSSAKLYKNAILHMAATYNDKLNELDGCVIETSLPCHFNDSIADIYSVIFMNHIHHNRNGTWGSNINQYRLQTNKVSHGF